MREIKFRAWDKESEEMMGVGRLDIVQSYDSNYMSKKMSKKLGVEINTIPMDYFILMQYTGLKDKSRKEIYEGDIVKIDNWSAKEIVCWCLVGWYPWLDIKIGGEIRGYSTIRAKIIGNIYENPELLTEEL